MAFAFQNPFVWGNNGQKLTPQQAAAMQQTAQALAQRSSAPKDVGEGLNAIGQALLAKSYMDRAQAAQTDGQQAVADALTAAQKGTDPNAYLNVLDNPWASEGQQAVAKALYEKAQPDWQSVNLPNGGAGRYDANSANPTVQTLVQGQSKPNWNTTYVPGVGLIGIDQNAQSPTPQTLMGAPPVQQPTPLSDDERKQFNVPQTASAWWQTDEKTGQRTPVIKNPPASTSVSVNTGDNSSVFSKKLDEAAATRMSDYVSGAQSAQSMLGDLQTLQTLGQQVQTGKGAEVLATIGPWAQALGVPLVGADGNQLGAAQAISAITSRMAPQMRIPGAGASSDRDVAMFLDALPNLGRTPEGNAIVNDTLQSVQQYKIAAGAIAQRAMLPKEQGGITWQEADKQIAALGNPYERFSQYAKTHAIAPPTADNTPKQGGAVEIQNGSKDGDTADLAMPDGSKLHAVKQGGFWTATVAGQPMKLVQGDDGKPHWEPAK